MERGENNHERQVDKSKEKKGGSRYEEDFIEIEKLGRGGYGSVYAVCFLSFFLLFLLMTLLKKVKHKLDGLMYAMKKIQFKNTSCLFLEKVLLLLLLQTPVSLSSAHSFF